MKITHSTPVGEIVRENFNTRSVFDRHKIDFCCAGNKTIGEYASEKEMDSETLIAELESIPPYKRPYGGLLDIKEKSLFSQIQGIIRKYHFYIREQYGELQRYLDKIEQTHGDLHPELKEVAALFRTSTQALLPHLDKEENVLFPYIIEMERRLNGEVVLLNPCFSSVYNPIEAMRIEHREEGDRFKRISELTREYTIPEEGCISYRIAMEKLADFEQKLHEHIHLENNDLFPRAIDLENRLRTEHRL